MSRAQFPHEYYRMTRECTRIYVFSVLFYTDECVMKCKLLVTYTYKQCKFDEMLHARVFVFSGVCIFQQRPWEAFNTQRFGDNYQRIHKIMHLVRYRLTEKTDFVH